MIKHFKGRNWYILTPNNFKSNQTLTQLNHSLHCLLRSILINEHQSWTPVVLIKFSPNNETWEAFQSQQKRHKIINWNFVFPTALPSKWLIIIEFPYNKFLWFFHNQTTEKIWNEKLSSNDWKQRKADCTWSVADVYFFSCFRHNFFSCVIKVCYFFSAFSYV